MHIQGLDIDEVSFIHVVLEMAIPGLWKIPSNVDYVGRRHIEALAFCRGDLIYLHCLSLSDRTVVTFFTFHLSSGCSQLSNSLYTYSGKMQNEPQAPDLLPHWRLVVDHSRVTPNVIERRFNGQGTEGNPFIVTWLPHDPGNPMNFSPAKKWTLSCIVAMSMLATTFSSSAFSGGYSK